MDCHRLKCEAHVVNIQPQPDEPIIVCSNPECDRCVKALKKEQP